MTIKLNGRDYLATCSEDKTVKIMPMEKILNENPQIECQIEEGFLV